MATRIYLLARDLGVPSKELMGRLQAQGLNVNNHLAHLGDEEESLARSMFAGVPVATAPPRKKRAPAKKKAAAAAPALESTPDGARLESIAAKIAELRDLSKNISKILKRRKDRAVRLKAAATPAVATPAPAVVTPPAAPVPPAVAPPHLEPPAVPAAVPEAAAAPPAAVEPAAGVPPPAEALPAAVPPAAVSPAVEAPPVVEAPVAVPPAAEVSPGTEAPPAAAPPSAVPGVPVIPGPPVSPVKKKRGRVITMSDRLRQAPKPIITAPATPLSRPPAVQRPAPPPRRAGGAPAAFQRGPAPSAAPPAGEALGKGAGRRRGGKKGVTRFFPTERQDAWSEGALPRMRMPRAHGEDQRGAARRPEKVDVMLPLTVKEFSLASGIRQAELIKFFLMRKTFMNANSHLSEELLEDLGIHFDITVNVRREADLEAPLRAIEEADEDPALLEPRPPVVTLLGHVDHGKTSILDYIRKANVHEKEHGGITQHISAYRIDLEGFAVTFVDTPGHAAFTAMRARGAQVTDIAVLVVAADDGPMPQTEEAISHILAANVGIVVAINKVDLPTANVMRAKQRLAELGLMPPEWGGQTEMVEVSAITGQGIPDLIETLHLMGEVRGLKANPRRDALGTVLEARSSGGRGILVTSLVQKGTLRVGDYAVCGQAHGRIRGMWSTTTGGPLAEAGPSTPVDIMGLSEVPEAGDKLYVLRDQQLATSIANDRLRRNRELERAENEQTVTLENFLKKLEDTEEKELRMVLKADVKGSVEAIQKQLTDLGTEEVKVKVLRAAVGMISEGDVVLAEASRGIVVGFNVTVDDRARGIAEERGVQIRTYHVIYELLGDVRDGLEDRLSPVLEEVVSGHAEVLMIFKASKIGTIAGCAVRDGVMHRIDRVRVKRDGRVIHEGELSSLQRGKDSVKDVREGYECGIKVAKFEDVQQGDIIEGFRIVAKRRTL